MASAVQHIRVSVDVPWSAELGDTPEPADLGVELQRLWIVEQVRLRRLGVGKGAELASMPRAAFMQLLGKHGVPVIDYSIEDLEAELRSLE